MKGLKEWVAIVISVLAFLGAMYTDYSHNDKENASRIAKLEAYRDGDKQRVDNMQTDVREIREDVKKLVQWAMGSK